MSEPNDIPDAMPPGTASTDAVSEEVIHQAYSLAVYPQNLDLFNTAVVEMLETASGDAELADALGRAAPHVSHAKALLERRGRQIDSGLAAQRVVEADPRPSAVLRSDGDIEYANTTARETLGLEAGAAFPMGMLSREGRAQLTELLTSMADAKANRTALTLGLEEPTERCDRIAFMKVYGEGGEPRLRLTALQPYWDACVGESLRSEFELTPSELAVMRALVEGHRIGDIASLRGRSTETIRKQVKAITTKTGQSSQSDLMTLYATYVEIGLKRTPIGRVGSETQRLSRERFEHTLPDGRQLACNAFGPRSGRPVLYFNGPLLGNCLHPDMVHALFDTKIRLIMPWRAGWEQSEPRQKGVKPAEMMARDADDMRDLWERVSGDGPVQGLAANTGCVSAFATMKQFDREGRGGALLVVGPRLPVEKLSELSFTRNATRKVYIAFARTAPALVEAYVRFVIAKIDSGFDTEEGKDYFRQSPHDMQLLENPDTISNLREAMHASTLQGPDAFVNLLRMEASKWKGNLDLANTRVHFMCGESDPTLEDAKLSDYVAGNPLFTRETVTGAGNLLFWQKPREIVERLQSQWKDLDA